MTNTARHSPSASPRLSPSRRTTPETWTRSWRSMPTMPLSFHTHGTPFRSTTKAASQPRQATKLGCGKLMSLKTQPSFSNVDVSGNRVTLDQRFVNDDGECFGDSGNEVTVEDDKIARYDWSTPTTRSASSPSRPPIVPPVASIYGQRKILTSERGHAAPAPLRSIELLRPRFCGRLPDPPFSGCLGPGLCTRGRGAGPLGDPGSLVLR